MDAETEDNSGSEEDDAAGDTESGVRAGEYDFCMPLREATLGEACSGDESGSSSAGTGGKGEVPRERRGLTEEVRFCVWFWRCAEPEGCDRVACSERGDGLETVRVCVPEGRRGDGCIGGRAAPRLRWGTWRNVDDLRGGVGAWSEGAEGAG